MAASKHFNSPVANPTATTPKRAPTTSQITVIIPTRGNAPTLPSVIDTIRRQTLTATIVIVDNSPDDAEANATKHLTANRPATRHMRILPDPNAHRSQIIAEALDAGTALATTTYVYFTHDDVWLKNERLFADYIDQLLTTGAHAIGYELSDRSHVTNEWRGMLSHTATMFRRLSMLKLDLRWNLEDPFTAAPGDPPKPGWPDTETILGRRIRALKLKTLLIAQEPNDPHFEDHNLVHRRSLTTHSVYTEYGPIKDAQWINDTIRRFADQR